MITLLALRNLAWRPWRSALLFLGYGLGVGVMIVLLSIGEALVTQARDERLVGGGQITVLPEGIDVEVMKTGGTGGLFFSIDHARFVYRQVLAAPRFAGLVAAAAPQLDGRLVYVRLPNGEELAVRASGEIPSLTRAVGAGPVLAAGRWADDDGDRRWTRPAAAELRHEIDHFHLPPPNAAHRDSWAEWHYFNVLSADGRRWAFISYIVGGDVGRGRWGGQLLVTLREQGGRSRRFVATVPPERVRLSTTDANVGVGGERAGGGSVTVLPDGAYRVVGAAAEEGGAGRLAVDLVVRPAPGAYFPGASLGGGAAGEPETEGEFVSGYVVPGLRADADGSLCVGGTCERYAGAQAYHDHNWGVWQGVTWEWGAARAGAYTLLYGRVEPPDEGELPASSDSSAAGAPPREASYGDSTADAPPRPSAPDRNDALRSTPLFLYLVDSLGFRAVFRPRRIAYEDARTIVVDGRPVRVPARAVMADVRGDDTLRVELEVEDAIGTDTRRPLVERGEALAARRLRRPYFIQMKGLARISGRVGGAPVRGEGRGFFETYR
ncbi:MAG: hypothetical protein ACJ8AO_07980 [Gemmatimonadaceae bacterium]